MKVAWIGAGRMGREHVRAFVGLPGVVATGLHSRTADRAQALAAEFTAGMVAGSVAELYERTRADLVVVAVPELAARGVAEACFDFPWTVLMEKPPGYCLEEGLALQRAAEARGRRVYVGMNRRCMSSARAVWEDLNSREESRYIHVSDQQSLAVAMAVGHPPEVVRHWMYANSIHVIDLLRCFGRGEVERVEVVQPWDSARPGVVLAVVTLAGGDLGLYEGIWNGPGPWSVVVTTASKRWEMRPLEQAAFQTLQERRLTAVPVDEWDREYKPGFRWQAQEVLAAVRGERSRAVTLAEAMGSMRLVQAIYGV